MIFSIKGITKALIRLQVCAGWSAPLLVANPRRKVFSRQGPNKMLVIRAGIHKMLVRIVNMEDSDQTSSSSLIWVHTVCLDFFGQLMFKRETDKH